MQIIRTKELKHRVPPEKGSDSTSSASELGSSPRAGRQLGSREDAQGIKVSEQGLKDSELRYRRLFESAHDGILILEVPTGAITDVNPFLAEILDYSHAEMLGKKIWDIGLPKDLEESKRQFQHLLTCHSVRYDDLPLLAKNGEHINVEVVSNVYQVNGDTVIQCNIRDIRKRKVAERLEQQIRQTQKMEAVGQLAGGLAHDFNNLLGVILGYCEILENQKELPEAAQKMIAEIHDASTSAKNLTQRLLAFSRRQVLQPTALDLNQTVNRVETMLSRLIGEDVELVCALSDDLGRISADRNQIEQVLINLVINARDAMPKGGNILIETANVEIDEAYAKQHSHAEPGSYVLLTVSDTGIGMDQELETHIFEPFFSTKPAGQGTGLGLSTVFGVVKQSGGWIEVNSELGHGASFKIYLPRIEKAPIVPQLIKEKPLLGGTETILLVDDAAPLRDLTRQILQDCGYNVLESGDPAEALHIALDHKGPIPLMITDVVMPGFGGSVLAEKLAAIRPETKVIYVSGYSNSSIDQLRFPGRDFAFLEKPFTREDLLRKVRDLLDS